MKGLALAALLIAQAAYGQTAPEITGSQAVIREHDKSLKDPATIAAATKARDEMVFINERASPLKPP